MSRLVSRMKKAHAIHPHDLAAHVTVHEPVLCVIKGLENRSCTLDLLHAIGRVIARNQQGRTRYVEEPRAAIEPKPRGGFGLAPRDDLVAAEPEVIRGVRRTAPDAQLIPARAGAVLRLAALACQAALAQALMLQRTSALGLGCV